LAAVVLAVCYTNPGFCFRSSVVYACAISENDAKVVARNSVWMASSMVKELAVACAAIEQKSTTERAFLNEFWYGPICG
jgi:hypothetical protein